MRILHTGDWHLGKNLEGQSRMDEQEMFLKDFVNIVEENKIDLIIIAGDVYDSPNPPARAEKMFYDTLKPDTENIGNSEELKKTATIISNLAQNLNISEGSFFLEWIIIPSAPASIYAFALNKASSNPFSRIRDSILAMIIKSSVI